MHVPISADSAPLIPSVPSRPLLKWAGGKRQLLPVLNRHVPLRFTRYIEPFFGSGAVFFDLAARGALDGRRVVIADVNPDLIGCYTMVRDHTDAVIAALDALAWDYRRRGHAAYYDVRDRRFNPARAGLARGEGGEYTPEIAAMLIFLNRTGFNGLFRLNRSGEFNVPAGRYSDPKICDAAHVRAVGAAFRREAVTIQLQPFDATLRRVGPGDFVYCDPPYAPLSRTASFANYTADGFSAFDQARLQRAVIAACRRGASVVVSNSSAREIVDLYSTPDARQAGLAVRRVPARRAINSRAESRGPVDELIVTNVAAGGRLRMAKMGAVVTRRAKTA